MAQVPLVSYEKTNKFISDNMGLNDEQFSMDEKGLITINQFSDGNNPIPFNITDVNSIDDMVVTDESHSVKLTFTLKNGNKEELHFNNKREKDRILNAFKNYYLIIKNLNNENKLDRDKKLFDETPVDCNSNGNNAAPANGGNQNPAGNNAAPANGGNQNPAGNNAAPANGGNQNPAGNNAAHANGGNQNSVRNSRAHINPRNTSRR